MAVNVPAELGGAGAGVVAYALAMQEVARACASTAVDDERHEHGRRGHRALRHRRAEGTRYCPRLASGEYGRGSFALSEPDAGQRSRRHADDGATRRRRMGARRRQAVDHERRARRRDGRLGAHGRPRRTGRAGISCFLVEGGHAGAPHRAGRGQDGHPRLEHRAARVRRVPRAGGRAPRRARTAASRSR